MATDSAAVLDKLNQLWREAAGCFYAVPYFAASTYQLPSHREMQRRYVSLWQALPREWRVQAIDTLESAGLRWA